MASQAPSRAGSPEVEDLAARIDAAQEPEIGQMNAMLTAWGVARPQPGAMTGMAGMPMAGMMSDQQMTQMATLSGPAFDRAFLTMMIAHHRGAVSMAQTELNQGQNPQAKILAQAIIDGQQTEIAEMQTLLARVH